MLGHGKKVCAIVISLAMVACLTACGCTAPSGNKQANAPAKPQVKTTKGVAENAQTAHITIQTSAELANQVSAKDFTVDGAFEGYTVSDVRRDAANVLSFTLTRNENTPQADMSYGYIMLDDDAFANPSAFGEKNTQNSSASSVPAAAIEEGAAATGAPTVADLAGHYVVETIALPVREAQASIQPLEGHYSAEENTIYLPVNLDIAELVREPTGSDFSIANERVRVTGASYDKDANTVTVRIDAPKDSIRDVFNALDAALTADGVRIAQNLTNCGEITAKSADMAQNEGSGSNTTALSCLKVYPSATVKDVYTLDDLKNLGPDASMTAYLVTQIETPYGSCKLPKENINDYVRVESLSGNSASVMGDDALYISDTELSVNMPVHAPRLATLAKNGELNDQAIQDAYRSFVTFARTCKLTFADGVICNRWGIPQESTSAPICFTDVQYKSKGTTSKNDPAFLAIEKAYADESESEKTAKGTLDLLQEVFKSASAFVMAASDENAGKSVGYALDGTSGLFGIVSKALGLTEGATVTLADVFNELESVDSEIRAVDAKVDSLATQLAAVEANLGYQTDLNSLRVVLAHTEMFGDSLQRDLGKVDWSSFDENGGYAALSDEQKNSIANFYKDVTDLEQTYQFSVADSTLMLGNLIAGDSTIASKSVLSMFFDCIDTQYNWEPETLEMRTAFYDRVSYAYLCGYMTTITKLQYEASLDGGSSHAASLKAIMDNFKKVYAVMATDGSNSLYSMTQKSTDGTVKNLVNGKSYVQADFSNNIYGNINDFASSEPDNVKTYKFDGTISRGDFNTMVGRLSTSGYSSLWDELVAVGLQPNQTVQSDASWDSNRSTAKVDEADNTWRFIVSDTTPHTIHNKPSVQHTVNWTGDYYDLKDNSCHEGAEIYISDQKYHSGNAHWYCTTTLHNYMVAR